MSKLLRALLPVLLLTLAAVPVRAASEGQADLDKATDTKLNATTISDLGEVVRLAESALKQGLDPANTDFANKLLASTLLQRAQETVKQILAGVSSAADLRQRRDFALADLDEAVRLAPGEAGTVRARGFLRADMGKLEPALTDLNKAIELDPDDSPTYEAKAIVLGRLKKYDEALAALDKARQLSPNSVGPWVQRARVHSTQAKLDAALEDLSQALAVEPGNVAVLLMRSSVHQEKGDKDKALADVDRALKLRPDLPLAIRTRALLLAESQRFDEAVGELEKLRKLDPKDTLTLLQLAMLLHVRGDIYLNTGKQAEAIADYEKAVKLQPKDQSILNNLAWVLATSPDEKLRNGRRAIDLATLACEATEYKAAYILSTLAAAYAETGDFQTAIKWSAKAVELGDKEQGAQLKKELESYQAKKPWRELLSEEKPTEKNESKPAAKP